MLLSGISNTTRFLFLLFIIFIDIALPPFLGEILETTVIFEVINTAILISTVFALNKNRRYITISAILAAPLISAIWLSNFTNNPLVVPTGLLFGILFFGHTAFHILKVVFSREYVTLEVILGTIVVYLMLGIIWSICYGFLETLYPGSFAFAKAGEVIDPYSLIYFSFVTLTTLGYGDTIPLTSMAQSLCIVEALVGQIYLVVLIAWLVGMHVAGRSLKTSNK